MADFDAVLDAINEGLNGGMPEPTQEKQPEELQTQEGDVMPDSEEASPNMEMAAEILSKLTKEGTWEEALQLYAEEHDMELEAVKAEVISSLASAGIDMAESEVEIEVSVDEVPADGADLTQELPK